MDKSKIVEELELEVFKADILGPVWDEFYELMTELTKEYFSKAPFIEGGCGPKTLDIDFIDFKLLLNNDAINLICSQAMEYYKYLGSHGYVLTAVRELLSNDNYNIHNEEVAEKIYDLEQDLRWNFFYRHFSFLNAFIDMACSWSKGGFGPNGDCYQGELNFKINLKLIEFLINNFFKK